VLLALGALYMAQGIPFGFATEYLPVVLRESGTSYTGIAALFWLQLPWQLKIFWARAADQPFLRKNTRTVVLVMQLGLTLTVAAFAARPLREAPYLWFGLTFAAAALAATQDVFVDAFAVRVLRPDERGYGNTAQVAGYRLGMLVGGAALLLVVGHLGERMTLLACAGVVALASIGAFFGTEQVEAAGGEESASASADKPAALDVRGLARHLIGHEARPVLLLALTFKLGLHMAGSLLKPMAVDYGWTKHQIGAAVVSVGSASALAGAAAGGALHRILHERRALWVALVVQALVCAPLVVVDQLHAPLGLTTGALALEHFGTGLGTTVLFAALMTATRPANAGLHYTVLQSANALGIGLGGLAGGLLADVAGKSVTFVVATLVCLAPALLLPRWNDAARASRS
jgi:predicted MFS family arabinose efflux permease